MKTEYLLSYTIYYICKILFCFKELIQQIKILIVKHIRHLRRRQQVIYWEKFVCPNNTYRYEVLNLDYAWLSLKIAIWKALL